MVDSPSLAYEVELVMPNLAVEDYLEAVVEENGAAHWIVDEFGVAAPS